MMFWVREAYSGRVYQQVLAPLRSRHHVSYHPHELDVSEVDDKLEHNTHRHYVVVLLLYERADLVVGLSLAVHHVIFKDVLVRVPYAFRHQHVYVLPLDLLRLVSRELLHAPAAGGNLPYRLLVHRHVHYESVDRESFLLDLQIIYFLEALDGQRLGSLDEGIEFILSDDHSLLKELTEEPPVEDEVGVVELEIGLDFAPVLLHLLLGL